MKLPGALTLVTFALEMLLLPDGVGFRHPRFDIAIHFRDRGEAKMMDVVSR